MTTEQQKLTDGLTALGYESLYGKGGYWLKDYGFMTTAQVRKLTGIKSDIKRKHKEKVQPWGDFATIAMMNGYKIKEN